MIPAAFDYQRAASLDEAIALLSRFGSDAKILAGGMSLLPMLKLRLAAFSCLIDISRLRSLEYVKEEDGMLKIGGATREALLERSELVRTRYPILLDTARVIADPLVRNRATVGGNLAHADPANDHPATMLALGASVVARGPNGDRSIAIREFFKGVFSSALAADEVLTEIRIPAPPPKSGGAYLKLERKVGDFAAAAVAVQITLGSDGRIARAGIGLTNAGVTPVDAAEAAQFLIGRTPDARTLAEAASMAATKSDPSADRRGSVEYKRAMARVLTSRALERALQRAQAH